MSALQVNVIDVDGINARLFVNGKFYGDLPGFYINPDFEATLYSLTPELYDELWAEIAEAQERGSPDPRRTA